MATQIRFIGVPSCLWESLKDLKYLVVKKQGKCFEYCYVSVSYGEQATPNILRSAFMSQSSILVVIWSIYLLQIKPIKIANFSSFRQNLKAIKTCDIINPVSLVSGADFCYVSSVLTTLKTLRYTKRTCTLAGFHIVARNLATNQWQIRSIHVSKLGCGYCVFLRFSPPFGIQTIG